MLGASFRFLHFERGVHLLCGSQKHSGVQSTDGSYEKAVKIPYERISHSGFNEESFLPLSRRNRLCRSMQSVF